MFITAVMKALMCVFTVQVKLVQHTYSCLYGTFLCNNAHEREAKNLYKRTCSVWSLLRTGNKNFQNFLYIPSHDMVPVSFHSFYSKAATLKGRKQSPLVWSDETC